MPRSAWLPLMLSLAVVSGSGCGGGNTQMQPPPPPPPPPPETFTTTTSQQGSLLILQNQTSTDTIRIGLETAWGGSIVEVSLNGTNFVNAHDTGREVQPAFYDGNAHYDSCAGCTGVFGWDPVLGGDKYDQGSPTLSQVLTSNSLYTKAHPLQWNPDDKGGGPGQAVAGDVIVEQTITPVSGRSRVFQGHYKVTHLGSDLHANAQQEFPAVYVNADYNRFVHYGGTAPWTNAAVSVTTFPELPTFSPLFFAPEHWAAHVNAQDIGLTVYVPSQYPYVGGFDHSGPAGPTGDQLLRTVCHLDHWSELCVPGRFLSDCGRLCECSSVGL